MSFFSSPRRNPGYEWFPKDHIINSSWVQSVGNFIDGAKSLPQGYYYVCDYGFEGFEPKEPYAFRSYLTFHFEN